MTPAQASGGTLDWDEPAARPRVLVIDDEEAIRSALSRALSIEGLTIELAESGEEGLRRALAERYDLVILDLLMPDLDGQAVLRQLLRDRPGQVGLVLSCLTDVRSKVDCFELGARDYLAKPFSLAELIARIRNQLRGDPLDRVIRVGGLRLHIGRMEADIGRGPTPLTRLEFLVLQGAHGTCWPVGLQGAAAGLGMGLRVRAGIQHRRRVRPAAAVEVR